MSEAHAHEYVLACTVMYVVGQRQGQKHRQGQGRWGKIGAGTGLAAIVILRTKLEVVLNQTLGTGIQLVLPS